MTIVFLVIGTMTSSVVAKELSPIPSKPLKNTHHVTPRYPAPDFTLTDQFGDNFSLSEQRGSVVAMMFWTSW